MFPMVAVCRKTGHEQFRLGSIPLGFDLMSFWQWSGSDLLGIRSQIAEYIVACGLGLGDGVCSGWGSHDLLTSAGLKIEVKSSGYLQGWAQKDYTKPIFGIKPARNWNPATGEMGKDAKRQSDLYIFALHSHREQATLDPLDVAQWNFYLLPAARLNDKVADQGTLSLSALLRLSPAICSYSELKSSVHQLYSTLSS